MQVLVCLIIICVFIPASDVCSKGKDQDVRGADDIGHPLLPFIRILFYLLKTAAITDMAVAMAGQFPAIILEGLHHRLGRLNLSFIIKGTVFFRVFISFLRRLGQIRIGPVAQNPVVTGECQYRFGPFIGKIRMLVDKFIKHRHQIIGTGHRGAVAVDIFRGRPSILAHHHL